MNREQTNLDGGSKQLKEAVIIITTHQRKE